MYEDIPARILDLDPPKDILIKLGLYIDLSKPIPESMHQKHILDSILIILGTEDSDESKLINLCFVIDSICPIQ